MISAAVLMSLLFGVPIAFAETDPILITKSAGLDKIVFDGKWTTDLEWKPTSWNELKYNQTVVQLRTAHQGEFIYIMIDAVDDVAISDDDLAVVCFDGKNNKNMMPDSDDYCFVASPNSDAVTYQGTDDKQFKAVQNPDGFIGIGTQSDQNDRYSSIPHASYEFRIPIELFGRSDNYGFFVSVYDSDLQKFYSWPDLQLNQAFQKISPASWGDLVSPDKSIPEFGIPIVILFGLMCIVVFFTKTKQNTWF